MTGLESFPGSPENTASRWLRKNVNAFRSQDCGFIRNMREYLKEDASFVLDVKQAVRSGRDPYEMCEAMGKT